MSEYELIPDLEIIPEGWEIKKLEDVAWEVSERGGDASDLPVLSVTKYQGFVASLEYFKKQIFSRDVQNYKIVRNGQFAYATIHLDEGSIDLLEYFEAGLISPMYTVFITKSDCIDPKFFKYKLKSPQMMRAYGSLGQGSVNRRKSISFDVLSTLNLLLPPLLEQQRISRALQRLDVTLEVARELELQARRVREESKEQLLTRGFDEKNKKFKMFQGIQIPDDWKGKALSECATIQSGIAKGKKYPNKETVEVPYLRVANVQDGYFDLTEIKVITLLQSEISRYLVQPGDVLLTEGGDADKLGRGHIWTGEIPLCVHQNHLFCVRTNKSMLMPEYFNILISSKYAKRYFFGASKQSTNLASINATQLKAFPCILPPLPEQQRIVTILETFDARLTTAKDYISQLETLKQKLLQALLTGQVRVPAEV